MHKANTEVSVNSSEYPLIIAEVEQELGLLLKNSYIIVYDPDPKKRCR